MLSVKYLCDNENINVLTHEVVQETLQLARLTVVTCENVVRVDNYILIFSTIIINFFIQLERFHSVYVNLAQLVGTLHNLCSGRGSSQ